MGIYFLLNCLKERKSSLPTPHPDIYTYTVKTLESRTVLGIIGKFILKKKCIPVLAYLQLQAEFQAVEKCGPSRQNVIRKGW